MGRLFKYLFFSTLLGLAVAFGALMRLKQWSTTSFQVKGEVILDFAPGTTLGHLSRSLDEKGVVDGGTLFQAYIRIAGSYRHFQAGHYRFTGTMTPVEVAETFIRGDVYSPLVAQIAVPEGFTIKQVIDRLVANGIGTNRELMRLAKNRKFLESLNVPGPSLEGFLYPATYDYRELPTGEQVLTEMVKTFWRQLPKNY
ncbi:hypothetical protein E3A20_05550, partial [Planctomyces bekefii]